MRNLILPPVREYRFGRYLSQLLLAFVILAVLLLLLEPTWLLLESVRIGGIIIISAAGTGSLILAVICLVRDPRISRVTRNRWLLSIFVLPLPAIIAFFLFFAPRVRWPPKR